MPCLHSASSCRARSPRLPCHYSELSPLISKLSACTTTPSPPSVLDLASSIFDLPPAPPIPSPNSPILERSGPFRTRGTPKGTAKGSKRPRFPAALSPSSPRNPLLIQRFPSAPQNRHRNHFFFVPISVNPP